MNCTVVNTKEYKRPLVLETLITADLVLFSMNDRFDRVNRSFINTLPAFATKHKATVWHLKAKVKKLQFRTFFDPLSEAFKMPHCGIVLSGEGRQRACMGQVLFNDVTGIPHATCTLLQDRTVESRQP